jgi:hypothetical protein
LIVIGIVVLVAVVLARGGWVSRQPGAFRGVIRVTGGEVPGLGMKWRRGYGCWVWEILVWTTAPLLFRDELVVADAAAGAARAADPGEVRCLGEHAAIVALAAGGGARSGVAVSADGRERASGPFLAGGWMR